MHKVVMLGMFFMLTVYSAEKNLQGDLQRTIERENIVINDEQYRALIVPQFF